MSVVSRAGQILHKEGLFPLLKEGMSFVWHSLQSHGEYFVVDFRYRDQPAVADVRPKIACVYKAIEDIAEYDGLLAQGYRFGVRKFPPRLKKGAIAFCVFVDKNLASESWAAANQRAKSAVDAIPYRVDFENGEVCVGASFTDPHYRGNKLNEYLNAMRTPFLKEHFITGRCSVGVANKASQKINDTIHGIVIARGQYFRFAGWRCWKEKPVAPRDNKKGNP
jgi:hypothetical protein